MTTATKKRKTTKKCASPVIQATPIKSEPVKQFTTLPKLTRKQQAFVNELKNNPKQSATKAVMNTYNTSYNSARAIASENLTKPSIISHLDSYKDIVEDTLTTNMIRYKDSDDIKKVTLSVDIAKYTHDKLFGKATQRTENTNLNVSIEMLLNNLDNI
jgi:hypothetical protein